MSLMLLKQLNPPAHVSFLVRFGLLGRRFLLFLRRGTLLTDARTLASTLGRGLLLFLRRFRLGVLLGRLFLALVLLTLILLTIILFASRLLSAVGFWFLSTGFFYLGVLFIVRLGFRSSLRGLIRGSSLILVVTAAFLIFLRDLASLKTKTRQVRARQKFMDSTRRGT